MKNTYSNGLFIILLLLFISCSSEKERLIAGKWSLTDKMIGGAPSSLWFKGDGTVIGPWEKHKFAMRSAGTYEFVSDINIKISMNEGYYKGNVYSFDIVKLNKEELILRNNYEDVQLKRIE